MRNKHKQAQLTLVKDVIDIIGGRWKGAVLASLCDRPKRFNELKRDVGPVTSRVLIKELKYLELSKLVYREEKSPGAIIYGLTEHGYSLNPLIESIVMWGQKHKKVVTGSQQVTRPAQYPPSHR